MNINTGIYKLLFYTIISLHAFLKSNKLRNKNSKILKIFDKINKINRLNGVLMLELFTINGFSHFILNGKLKLFFHIIFGSFLISFSFFYCQIFANRLKMRSKMATMNDPIANNSKMKTLIASVSLHVASLLSSILPSIFWNLILVNLQS